MSLFHLQTSIEVVIVHQTDCWTAISKQLHICGSGNSEVQAIEAFKTSWLSKLNSEYKSRMQGRESGRPAERRTVPSPDFTNSGQEISTRTLTLSAEELERCGLGLQVA